MANPHTITLTSAAEQIGVDSDTYQIILVFTVDTDSTNQTHTFADKSLVILDRGKSKWEYDLEDTLIAPQTERLKISDKDGYLTGLLFDLSAEQAATQKQFTVEIKRTGTQVFKGTTLEDSIEAVLIESTGSSYELIFEAMPDTQILNNLGLFDSKTSDTLDPLSYGSAVTKQIQTVILDCYKKVNSGVSLEVDQNWLFSGTEILGVATIADRPFSELHQEMDPIFQSNTYAIGNLSDVLKHYAQAFGCYTGFIDFDNVFFRKLFHYDSGNTQTLGTVLSVKSQYLFNKIDFIRLIDAGNQAVKDSTGIYTEIESKKLDIDDPFFINGVFGDDMTFIKNGGTDYGLEDIEDGDFQGSAQPYDETFTAYWANFRGDITKLRTEEFEVVGVDYTITKSFTYSLEGNTFKYQPIFLEIDWEAGTSKIRALNLGV